MANKAAIECVDSLLRQIVKNELPFGNKTFLALSDFCQVAPVLRDVTALAAVYDSSIRSSSLWTHFQILRLTQPIRNAGRWQRVKVPSSGSNINVTAKIVGRTTETNCLALRVLNLLYLPKQTTIPTTLATPSLALTPALKRSNR
jgi:hypothetical protein